MPRPCSCVRVALLAHRSSNPPSRQRMETPSVLYEYSSAAITVTLFASIIVANELSFRIGRFIQDRTDSEIKTLTGAIQASILGLLALLLGFTFSMSMQRYDNRSLALIAEANAIGTATLRVKLLPTPYQAPFASLLREYVDLRTSIAKIDLTHREDRKAYDRQIAELQGRLWALAAQVAHEEPNPVTAGLFIASLNEMIDAQGKRNALLQMHVPETVILLLFLVFIASGGILGYSSGLSGKRVVAPTVMVSLLIALVVFIILDLDRPKRGFIQVNQGPMILLQESFR